MPEYDIPTIDIKDTKIKEEVKITPKKDVSKSDKCTCGECGCHGRDIYCVIHGGKNI